MKPFLTLMAAAVFSSAAFAQTSGRPEPAFTELREALKLTDAQMTQLRNLESQTRESLRAAREEIQTKRAALRTALDNNVTDPATLSRLLLEMEAARKRIEAARASARSSALAILTADQQAALARLEEAAKLRFALGQAYRLNLIAPGGADRAEGRQASGFWGRHGELGRMGRRLKGFAPRGARQPRLAL